jgi:hypothetical protein
MAHAAHHSPSPRQARTALLLHAGIYCAVNVLLVLINLWTAGGYWFQWPLLGWGAGLALHAWLVASRVGLRPSELDRGAAPPGAVQPREEVRDDGDGV